MPLPLRYRMICLAVTYVIQPGAEDQAVVLFSALTDATRAEPGNVMYVVHRAVTDGRRFFLYEQYESQAALDAHRAAPHFARYATNGLYAIAESRIAEVYAPIT